MAGAVVMSAAGLLVTVLLVVRPFDRAADRTGGGRDGVNPESYDLLLRARYLSVRTTDSDNQNAIALLERAIKLDQSFAAAYAELASAYATRLAYVKPDETRELEERAFSTAEKALARSECPRSLPARGDLLWTHSHKFAHERAVNEFRKALSLNPNSIRPTGAWRVCSSMSASSRKHSNTERALAINPSNAQALNSRAQALLWSGKDEEALAILQSIPGPVLRNSSSQYGVRIPSTEHAGTGVGEAARGTRQISGGSKRRAAWYGGDARGRLRSQQGSSVDPKPAATKAANPSHHAAYFAGCALARMRSAAEAVQWLREAAATGFPCYSLFALATPIWIQSVRTLAFRRSRRRWRGRPRHSAGRCFRR